MLMFALGLAAGLAVGLLVAFLLIRSAERSIERAFPALPARELPVDTWGRPVMRP